MKTTLQRTVTCLALIMSFVLPGLAQADWDGELVIVITETQLQSESTQNWLQYLSNLGVPVKIVKTEDFDSVKTAKYMSLMATPGDPQLNGDLLSQLLDEQEIAWLTEPGNRKVYYLDDKFAPGQTIIVFAGSSQRGAETARQNSKEDWELTYCGWFDIVMSTITLFGY